MPTQILIIDDSLLVRGLLRSMVTRDNDLAVIATSTDGIEGLDAYKQHRPDIVLMDIEMPRMDGLTCVKEILAFDPKANIIMCSSLTKTGSEMTCKALNLGALDFLTKPSSQSVDRSADFEQELVAKIKAISQSRFRLKSTPAASGAADTPKSSLLKPDETPPTRVFEGALPRNFPLAVAIGASTGGLQATIEVLKKIDENLMVPIFITQHLPEGFAVSFADNIQRQTGMTTHAAEENMLIEPGHVYIAPGNRHMRIKKGLPRRITLDDGPPVSYCKPSIDVMLQSIDEAYGDHIIAALLTGMGSDGRTACHGLIKDGRNNILLAQDQDSSVVWGIPGAVAKDGICHYIQPPAEIGQTITRLLRREK